jgi:hypothetical protein
MAVGSQQRNRIDNAMYELLADLVQEDVEKAAGGDYTYATPTRPHRGLQQPHSVADNQIPEAFTQGYPQSQGQVPVSGILEVAKSTEEEEAEDKALMQPIGRHDNICSEVRDRVIGNATWSTTPRGHFV